MAEQDYWQQNFDELEQSHKEIEQAKKDILRQNPDADISQLDMNRIRIEAEINRQIDSLYTPENLERYLENAGEKFPWREVD